jgi:hypothetical protein
MLTGGCELLKNSVKVDSDTYGYTFYIDPSDPGTYDFEEGVITTGIDAILKDNNIKEKKLKSAKITEMTAYIYTDHSFDIVDDGEIYFKMNATSAKKTIAWLPSTIPAGATELDLDFTSDDLKDYILQDEFVIGGWADLNSAIENQAIVYVEFSFELEARVL